MELTERYIYAVVRHLPESQREDVANELRGLIEDTLDEKGSRSKKTINEVLTELGDPELLARQYRGAPQYLIGPKYYSIYLQALKMTFAIGLPIGGVIVAIDQIVKQPESIIGFFIALVGGLVMISIQILFWLTALFVIFERTNVDTKDLKTTPWTPDMLPEISMKRQIPLSDAVGDMVWYALIIALPLIAQPLIGAHVDGQTTPFFNPQIPTLWIVVFVALGVVGFVKAYIKLRLHRWTTGLAAFNAAFSVIFVGALLALVSTVQLVNPAFITLLDTHIDTASFAQVAQWVNWSVGITIGAMVVAMLYDAGRAIWLARNTK